MPNVRSVYRTWDYRAAVPDCLAFDRYLDVIRGAAGRLTAHAEAAGPDAPVPTCPRWKVADLVAHQGIVHRWAASVLRLDETPASSKTEIQKQVPAEDLVAWFTAGAREVDAALRDAAPDVAAMVFLNDPPAPRLFWARRQAHETMIHAVDAVAASLGRFPTAAEVDVDDDVALDGIDELLTGFFTRGASPIADDLPFTVAVLPDDHDRAWTMHVVDGRMTTTREHEDAEAQLTGSAQQLYLGLWNRGTEITASGRREVLDRWRANQRVRWS